MSTRHCLAASSSTPGLLSAVQCDQYSTLRCSDDLSAQLPEATEEEEDLLDKAPFLDVNSRYRSINTIEVALAGTVDKWISSFLAGWVARSLLLQKMPDWYGPSSYQIL